MLIRLFAIVVIALTIAKAYGQATPLSQQMAATAMTKWKDSLVTGSSKDGRSRWGYQESVVLKGIEELYKTTGDKKYYDEEKVRNYLLKCAGKNQNTTQTDLNKDCAMRGLQSRMRFGERFKK